MDTNYAALLTPFVLLNWNCNGGFFLYKHRHFHKVQHYGYSKWILAKTLTLIAPSVFMHVEGMHKFALFLTF